VNVAAGNGILVRPAVDRITIQYRLACPTGVDAEAMEIEALHDLKRTR